MREDDELVVLAGEGERAVGHGGPLDRGVVEDVVVDPGGVEQADLGFEPDHAANKAQVQIVSGAGCGGGVVVKPGSGLDGAGGKEEGDIADMLSAREEPAETRYGCGKRRVVAPVGLPPVGGGGSPFEPATASGVVHGVGIVEIGAGPEPGHEPVECLLKGAIPARGVEGFDPDAGMLVEVGQRGVELGLTVVIGPRRAEPAMGFHVVGVDIDGANGVASAGWILLVDPDDHAALLMPVVKGLEERLLGKVSAGGMVVVANLIAFTLLQIPQRVEVRDDVVAVEMVKDRGEVVAPARQRRQLILKGARDDGAEHIADMAFEFAMDGREEVGTGCAAEVIEAGGT